MDGGLGHCTRGSDQDHPQEKEIQKGKMVHTAKGFGIVNKAEIDVFWNSLAFLMIQRMLAI